MATTAVLLMPYPTLTDTPDVPRDVKAVSDRVEAVFVRQRAWTIMRTVDGAAAASGAFVFCGPTLTIANAPVGDWMLNWSTVVSFSNTAAGNIRYLATTNSVTTNMNNDSGMDLTAGQRTTNTYTTTIQTTVVSTLTIESWVLGSGGGSFTGYAGSRASAFYLGPR
jgi:hypothetical protein